MSGGAAPEIFGGRFEVDAELGRGGMAVVFAARDRQTGQRAAVKVLTGTPDDETRARFAREVRAAGALDHPGICRVLAFGDERGAPWLAMELVDGQTLAQLGGRGPVPASVAAEVLRQLLSALEVAHAAGIVHRDLKPTNVMLAKDGSVKLLDFGIAKAAGDHTVTETGALVGTPAFMSPEAARSHTVDARSDLFSAGLTIAALLRRNKHRFAGLGLEPTQLLLRVAVEPTAPLCEDVPETPVAMDAIVAALCAIDPADRPADAKAARQALERCALVEARANDRAGNRAGESESADDARSGDRAESLLARFARDPAGTAAQERSARALIEARAAESLARVRGGEAAAALCAYRATLLDPSRTDAAGRLKALRAAHGFAPGESLEDERVHALDAGLKENPDNAALLLQKARLMKERGDLSREAAALWRAVRAKNEPVALERLRTILCGPAGSPIPEIPRAVREMIGSRTNAATSTGVSRVPTGVQPARALTLEARPGERTGQMGARDVVITASRDLESTSWVGRGIVAALLLLACAALVWMVAGTVRAGRKQMDLPPEKVVAPVAAIERSLRLARTALDGGDAQTAQQAASEVLETEGVSLETGREALWIRALARKKLGLHAQARKDLVKMKEMGAPDDPRHKEIEDEITAIDASFSNEPER